MDKVVEMKSKMYVLIKTFIRVQYCACVKYQQLLNIVFLNLITIKSRLWGVGTGIKNYLYIKKNSHI